MPNREETARDRSQEEVIIPPRISQESEEQSTQRTEMELNPLNIEVRTQDEGIRTVRESNVQGTRLPVNVIPLSGLSEQIQVLSVNTSVSENDSETLRGSHVRSQESGM